MNILGISAYHGDASAALVVDGELVAAVEEERFRRVKHWAGFPIESVRKVLEIGGIAPKDVDRFAIARDPKANLLRKVGFALRARPSRTLVADRLKNSRMIADAPMILARELGLEETEVRSRFRHVEHHPSHLASAFFVSPFEEAAVAAIDGFGDFVSTSFAHGEGTKLDILDRVFFPHSLGIVYLAITQHLGFPKYGDEYKVMGLAPYGKPEHVDKIRELVKLRPKGKFELDLRYFRHWTEGASMTWEEGEPKTDLVYGPKLEELLGPARAPGEPVGPRHEDIAASLQVAHEGFAFHVLNGLHERVGSPRLALAGGCAMNSVANGKIRANTPFREVYIQPAAGDNGTAIGAAYMTLHKEGLGARGFVMRHSYWGPSFTQAQIDETVRSMREAIDAQGCRVSVMPDEDALVDWTSAQIAEGKVVGWFQGRMEWGARALGNRSIVADPRRIDMREIINVKIKFRERFRPFAPSVAEEAVHDYFVDAVADPFMIQVYPVREERRRDIPAVTHVDGSGRLQTVHPDANPLYWKLLKSFEKKTGVPVVLNTSFNENEPIVHHPREALACFLRTHMDVIVLGRTVIEKGGTA